MDFRPDFIFQHVDTVEPCFEDLALFAGVDLFDRMAASSPLTARFLGERTPRVPSTPENR